MRRNEPRGRRRAEKVSSRRRRAESARGRAVRRFVSPVSVDAAEAPTPVAAPPAVPSTPVGDALDELLETDLDTAVGSVGTRRLAAAVDAAVRRTVAEESAAAGELVAGRLRDIDVEYALSRDEDEHCPCCLHYVDPDDGPGEWERMRLLRGLIAARERADDAASTSGAVVAWVAARLGRSGPHVDRLARHLGGAGVRCAPGEPSSRFEATLPADDDIAVLVWLTAGLVAVVGGASGSPRLRTTRP